MYISVEHAGKIQLLSWLLHLAGENRSKNRENFGWRSGTLGKDKGPAEDKEQIIKLSQLEIIQLHRGRKKWEALSWVKRIWVS